MVGASQLYAGCWADLRSLLCLRVLSLWTWDVRHKFHVDSKCDGREVIDSWKHVTKTLHFSLSPGISLNFIFPVWYVHRDANQFLLSAAHLIDFRVRKKSKAGAHSEHYSCLKYPEYFNLLHHSNSKEGCVCNKEMDDVYTCSLFSRVHIIFSYLSLFRLMVPHLYPRSCCPTSFAVHRSDSAGSGLRKNSSNNGIKDCPGNGSWLVIWRGSSPESIFITHLATNTGNPQLGL